MKVDVGIVADQSRLERWEKLVEWPLVMLSVLYLGAYAWEVLADLDGSLRETAELVLNGIWLVFLIDYLLRFALAPEKVHWFVRHLFDLAVVTLPLLRPLRLLRLINLVRILGHRFGTALRGKIVLYSASSVMLMIFVASLAVLEAERDVAHASISNFTDALWWAFVTITTVGYGDMVPVTETGRFIAACLMIGGVALIGVVTATIASWVVDRVSDNAENDTQKLIKEIQQLRQEVVVLRQEMLEKYGEASLNK